MCPSLGEGALDAGKSRAVAGGSAQRGANARAVSPSWSTRR